MTLPRPLVWATILTESLGIGVLAVSLYTAGVSLWIIVPAYAVLSVALGYVTSDLLYSASWENEFKEKRVVSRRVNTTTVRIVAPTEEP